MVVAKIGDAGPRTSAKQILELQGTGRQFLRYKPRVLCKDWECQAQDANFRDVDHVISAKVGKAGVNFCDIIVIHN
jgi:hypothetical protein